MSNSRGIMESITWVIEKYIFDDSEYIKEEVERNRGKVYIIDILDNKSFKYETERYCLEDRPTVFRGSLNIGRLCKNQPWYPGVICNERNFRCSSYYTYWIEWLLNKNYWYLSIRELKYNNFISQCLSAIKDKYHPKVFIRPDSGMKIFNGQIYDLNDLNKLYYLDDDINILISQVKEVEIEWRFIISERNIITGSRYQEYGVSIYKSIKDDDQLDLKVLNYLSNMLSKIQWEPDPIYCVDICKCQGSDDLFVLELNSFSCSSLYAADIIKVVDTVNRIALREWNHVNF